MFVMKRKVPDWELSPYSVPCGPASASTRSMSTSLGSGLTENCVSGCSSMKIAAEDAAMNAFGLLCRTEGIIPAIESAHAVAGALKLGQEVGRDTIILVNLSGRGDKDVETAAKWFGLMDGEP